MVGYSYKITFSAADTTLNWMITLHAKMIDFPGAFCCGCLWSLLWGQDHADMSSHEVTTWPVFPNPDGSRPVCVLCFDMHDPRTQRPQTLKCKR